MLTLDVRYRPDPVVSSGSDPFAAVQASDSSGERFRRGWRSGAGSAGGPEGSGEERRHGSVLPQVRYVLLFC